MAHWRALWWLVIGGIAAGALTGWAVHRFLYMGSETLIYQMAALLLIYSVVLGSAAVLLKPIYNWQQMMARFGEHSRRETTMRQLRFLFGLEKEL